MLIIKDISNLQSYLTAYQNRKYSIGFIPTMGALHKGHGELIKRSKNDNYKTGQKIIRDKALDKKVDVNKFMEWFILNYPNSYEKIKENPSFQYKIK